MNSRDKSLFLVSGERSGDLHAAELLAAFFQVEVRDEWAVHGLGGPELSRAYGEPIEDWVEEAAVIGFTEVIKKYGWFRQKFAETLARIETIKPELVILVDYPGFNLRLAKALRKTGYAGKICYYISPQVWAWNQGRIPKMAEILDLMLCVFEFEKPLYENSGLPTEWVGHPMVEELEERRIETTRRENVVGLFPGSRSREVRTLLPVMLEAAERLSQEHPELEFELAVASDKIQALVTELVAENEFAQSDKFTAVVGEAYRLMQDAGAAWVASGTASLEAGFYELPYALVYKVSSVTYAIAKMVVKIPYIGMVNILADKPVVREFIQGAANGENLYAEMHAMLYDQPYREKLIHDLAQVKTQLGGGGAHKKAALAIADCLSKPMG